MNLPSTVPILRKACLLGLILAMGAVACLAAADSSTYTFTTLAGISSIGHADGAGGNARFFGPLGVATDAAGNVFVADTGNHTIRKITADGIVSTFAGAPGRAGSADGADARFDSPQCIALDAAGNLYVTDAGNHTVRKIAPAGIVSTLAGQPGTSGNADGTGNSARFNAPLGIAVDATGTVFVTDAGNRSIRKISPAGVVSTLEGRFYFPDAESDDPTPMPYGAIAIDPAGNLFVSHCELRELNYHLIEGVGSDFYWKYAGFVTKITPTGAQSVEQYTSTRYYTDEVRHPQQKEGSFVGGIAFKPTGELVTSDFPLAIDRTGNQFWADTSNNVLRKIAPAGTVTLFAGFPASAASGTVDGTSAAARFVSPAQLVVDSAGNLFATDSDAHCIRKITPTGTASVFTGAPGLAGSSDGPANATRFSTPTGLAIDRADNLYVIDSRNGTIRKVTPAGQTTTLAGTPGETGTEDGNGAAARFFAMNNLAVDSTGTVYLAEYFGLRKITPSGAVTTVPSTVNTDGYLDASGSTRWLTGPHAVAFDRNDNLFVTDYPGHEGPGSVRKVTPSGKVATVINGETDRIPLSCWELALGSDGSLFTTDVSDPQTAGHSVLKIAPDKTVSTIAGLPRGMGHADGTGSAARFISPHGLAVDNAGALYLASGTTIRKGVLATAPVIAEQPLSQSVALGSSVTFSATASGQPAPTYQWHRNGTPLSGATARTLTLNNLTATDAGSYTLVATNDVGQATSNPAVLTVGATSPLPADGNSGGGGALSARSLLVLATLGLGRWRLWRRGTT